ncbi:hypothetical protein EDD21DRAFT_368136 [Dissophora ornata]|nr:hypothetical protein EDD21DRAFT_368136 [Dissophora ornata]
MKEKDLLTKFLVGNELHDSVTSQQFAQLFPASYQSHPEIKDLYRAYLNARHQVRSKVRRNIDIEVRRNPFHLDQQTGWELRGGVTEEVHGLDDDATVTDDMDIEDVDKHLTLDQAIQELLQAENIIKREIGQLEKECDDFAQEFQELDREMSSMEVPNGAAGVANEKSLMGDLQSLIALCDSITGSAPME